MKTTFTDRVIHTIYLHYLRWLDVQTSPRVPEYIALLEPGDHWKLVLTDSGDVTSEHVFQDFPAKLYTLVQKMVRPLCLPRQIKCGDHVLQLHQSISTLNGFLTWCDGQIIL